VNAAKKLDEETGRPVVPIFWLQTEDHDLVEIASCRVPCARGDPLLLSIDASPDNRISVAHLSLPPAISSLYAMMATELTGLTYAQETLDLIGKHYRPGAGWSQAFAGMLAELFDGLILIDPRDAAFSRVANRVHAHAIREAKPIAAALITHCEKLERTQVQVRPELPLSFFHPQGPEGPRTRIDLPHEPSERPLVYSTGALLRPILQDSLLPTAAYVGGPAELAYFRQLDPLYAAYGLPMPLVLERAHLSIVEEKVRRVLERRSLTAADASLAEDVLLARIQSDDPTAEQLGASLLEPFARELAKIGAGEPSLAKPVEKTLSSVERSLGKLMEKVRRAQLRRDHALLEDVRRLKLALMPEGVPQERYYSLPYYLARYGKSFLERVHAVIDPFDPTLKELTP
jgi:uncharacterized protein YllA (UPF0747 family)